MSRIPRIVDYPSSTCQYTCICGAKAMNNILSSCSSCNVQQNVIIAECKQRWHFHGLRINRQRKLKKKPHIILYISSKGCKNWKEETHMIYFGFTYCNQLLGVGVYFLTYWAFIFKSLEMVTYAIKLLFVINRRIYESVKILFINIFPVGSFIKELREWMNYYIWYAMKLSILVLTSTTV